MSAPLLRSEFLDTHARTAVVRAAPAQRFTATNPAAPEQSEARYDTVFSVVNDDSFAVAAAYARRYRTCVLNMASDYCPGGGVRNGARAQEEELCRRSNLYRTLCTAQYPLDCYTALYSPEVHVIKGTRYQLITPFRVSVISMAALRHPEIIGGRYIQRDYQTMICKVRHLLRTVRDSAQEVLVLGAFGCGVFGNPPRIVSRIFRQLLTTEFRGCFRQVVFAVLCGRDTTNFDEFAEVFTA